MQSLSIAEHFVIECNAIQSARDLDTKAPPLLGGVFKLKIETVLDSSEFMDKSESVNLLI